MINVYYYNSSVSKKVKSLSVKQGTTIDIFLTNILGLDLKTNVGVYGKLVDGSYVIRNNDRIELYEEVIADPKIKRKKMACDEKY